MQSAGIPSGIIIRAHDNNIASDVHVPITEDGKSTGFNTPRSFPPPSVKPIYEDFTTYTKVDPNNHIDVLLPTHVYQQALMNETAYLYKDKGANFFGDFAHAVDVQSDFFTPSIGTAEVWMLSNNLGDLSTLWNEQEPAIGVLLNADSIYDFYIFEIDSSGNYYASEFFAGEPNTYYYLIIQKVGTTLTCEIYDTAAHRNARGSTGLLATLSLTLTTNYKFRYIYACSTDNEASDAYIDDDIQNLNIGLSLPHTFTVPSTDPQGNPFKQWNTGQTSTTITISQPGTYIAIYEAEILTVSVNDPTLGTTDGTYPPGTYPLSYGTVVSVTATPTPNRVFAGWLLDGINVGNANPYTLTMNASHTLEAVFTRKYVKSITISQNLSATDAYVDDVSMKTGATENVVNGGFDTGSFPPWTASGNATISGITYHSPPYSCYLNYVSGGLPTITQVLNLTQKVTSFTLWSQRNTPCPSYGNLQIVITYTDNSTQTINQSVSGDSSWTQHDLTSQLQDG